MARSARSAAVESRDLELRARADRVIPGGMYGHQNAAALPPEFPQFMARGRGCRVWDVDGREYIDLVCSYGPIVLGHADPRVEAAAEMVAQEWRAPALMNVMPRLSVPEQIASEQTNTGAGLSLNVSLLPS